MRELIERYKEMCKDFELKKEIKEAFRVNILKINDKELIERLIKNKVKLEKIRWLSHGYYYSAKFPLSTTTEHLLGYFYIQSPPSQLVAEILAPSENELVLDMCSAPGGKATHLAMLTKNKGKIVAVDKDNNRLTSLRNNIERLGITNIIVVKKDARYVSELGLKFDKVLLDAPCSGNFCSEENWFNKREIEHFIINAKKQKRLLEEAYKVLNIGGILVYSTCSLEVEEDEEVIDWFIKKYSDMKLEKIEFGLASPGLTRFRDKKFSQELNKCLRFWPHKTGTEGFFIAKLRKI